MRCYLLWVVCWLFFIFHVEGRWIRKSRYWRTPEQQHKPVVHNAPGAQTSPAHPSAVINTPRWLPPAAWVALNLTTQGPEGRSPSAREASCLRKSTGWAGGRGEQYGCRQQAAGAWMLATSRCRVLALGCVVGAAGSLPPGPASAPAAQSGHLENTGKGAGAALWLPTSRRFRFDACC